MIEITEAATDVLHRAYDAAQRFNPDARVRIFKRGDVIETGFVDGPDSSDTIVEHDGMTLFVSSEVISGVLDVTEQHDRLVLRT